MLRLVALAALALLAGRPAVAQDGPNPSFYLVNRSPLAIARVFASPAGMTGWGSDRLGGGPLRPGANAPIRLPADGSCVYDLRIVYANGSSQERRGLNTCEIDNLSVPGGEVAAARAVPVEADPSFVLVNRGRTALQALYLSPAGDAAWGADRLGAGTLAAGTSRAIRLPPGECIYDLRAVFTNGEANEKRGLNLCQLADLRVP